MKKQLLSESEIRQFMKFANIGALASPFVERLSETYEMGLDEQEEDEDLDAGGMTDPDAMSVAGDEQDLDAGDEEDLDLGPVGGDVGGGVEDAALKGVMDAVQAMRVGFQKKAEEDPAYQGIADAIGLSATGDAELDGGGLDDDFGPVPDEDLEVDDEAGGQTSPDAPMSVSGDEQDVDDDLNEAGIYLENATEDDVVQEVARRVAKRLLAGRRETQRRRPRRR